MVDEASSSQRGDVFKNAESGFDDEQVELKIASVVAYLKLLQEQ